LKGRFVLAPTKHDAIVKAIAFFEQATSRDPRYALAYAWLGRCYTMLPISSDVPPGDAFSKAALAARRALELDPQSVDANTVLGWIALWHDWDWIEAEARFRRALALDPGDALAHLGYGALLSDLGRHDDAIQEGDLALGLDPVSVYGETLKAHYYYQARRYPEALEHVHRALELDSTFWIAQITLGKIDQQVNRHDDAVVAFAKAGALSGGNAEPISLRGYSDAVEGNRDGALDAVRQLGDLARHQYVPAHYVALVYQGLGDSNEALRWLERAYGQRDVHLVFLAVDPKWDGLRGDPRFIALLKRMKLPA
jgi:serine/threonine-protein kinase